MLVRGKKEVSDVNRRRSFTTYCISTTHGHAHFLYPLKLRAEVSVCVSWLHHFNTQRASGSLISTFVLHVSSFLGRSSVILWFRRWDHLQIRQMSSFYGEEKECSELRLSGDLTQVNSEELEFDYLFNYEPPNSDFHSGDLKGLFLLMSLMSMVCGRLCVGVWNRLLMFNCSAVAVQTNRLCKVS